jgi:hypothetical protein
LLFVGDEFDFSMAVIDVTAAAADDTLSAACVCFNDRMRLSRAFISCLLCHSGLSFATAVGARIGQRADRTCRQGGNRDHAISWMELFKERNNARLERSGRGRGLLAAFF